jgi:AraC-like DNA-binding protein
MTGDANRMTARATTTSNAGPPTPAAQFRAFVIGLERLGYDTKRLLSEIDVRRDSLDDPDVLIPCATTGALFAHACRQRPLKNIGMRVAAETPFGASGLLEYLIFTSENVAEGWKQAARYLRMLSGAPFVLELCEDEDPVRVVHHAERSLAPAGAEYSITLAVLQMRAETENRVAFAYVSLSHQPEDVAEMERVLGCPVRSGASWTGLAIPRESWRLPLRRTDPLLHRVLEGHAESLAPRGRATDTAALDVRRVLTARMSDGATEVDVVARHLGMSTRTLQRRLAAAGISFQELLDETRREAAERCLTDSSLSIGEVAYLLGYSEPAAFHRAFKRWMGVTPQIFRARRHSAQV